MGCRATKELRELNAATRVMNIKIKVFRFKRVDIGKWQKSKLEILNELQQDYWSFSLQPVTKNKNPVNFISIMG